jgi:hypothetical protein
MPLTPNTRHVLLAVYLVAVALVFLYVGFPSEALRTHVAYRLSASLPGLTLAVAEVRRPCFRGHRPADVRISHGRRWRDRPAARQPDLLSLLVKTSYGRRRHRPGDITGRRGRFHRAAAESQPECASAGSPSAGPRLRGLYGSRLAGCLDGNLVVNEAGTTVLTVTDGQWSWQRRAQSKELHV